MTLDASVTPPPTLCTTAAVATVGRGGEPMGRITDVNQSIPHNDSGSYDGGDSEVKTTRQGAATLRRPWRRDQDPKRHKFQGGSVPARDRQAAASWIGPGAGTSRDGRRSFVRLGLKTGNLQTRQRILDFDGNKQDFSEE
jgi:hypothetical protein